MPAKETNEASAYFDLPRTQKPLTQDQERHLSRLLTNAASCGEDLRSLATITIGVYAKPERRLQFGSYWEPPSSDPAVQRKLRRLAQPIQAFFAAGGVPQEAVAVQLITDTDASQIYDPNAYGEHRHDFAIVHSCCVLRAKSVERSCQRGGEGLLFPSRPAQPM